jgi:thiamine pyrophosphate-dependent acetolactate synthase large subunit-like protein
MIRYQCLQLLAARTTDQLVVTSQSGQRIEWAHLSKHEGNLLVGMMGCAIGVATGLALALPHRKIVALDSDGSVLLSLFNLATLGNLRPKNLVVYVFDNGVYSGSRISYPTATSGNTDLEAMARGAGVENAHTVRDIDDFEQRGLDALVRNELGFYVCKVEESLMHREICVPISTWLKTSTACALPRAHGRKTIPFLGRG